MYQNLYLILYSNTHDKLCQLKLSKINYYVYCHIKFGANFDIQFGIPNVIQRKKVCHMGFFFFLKALTWTS